MFANGGGIGLEHCAVTDDEHACALEYNVVRWGRTELPPQAGVAVYVRAEGRGKLAVARIYDDVDPPRLDDVAVTDPPRAAGARHGFSGRLPVRGPAVGRGTNDFEGVPGNGAFC